MVYVFIYSRLESLKDILMEIMLLLFMELCFLLIKTSIFGIYSFSVPLTYAITFN